MAASGCSVLETAVPRSCATGTLRTGLINVWPGVRRKMSLSLQQENLDSSYLIGSRVDLVASTNRRDFKTLNAATLMHTRTAANSLSFFWTRRSTGYFSPLEIHI